MSYIFPVFLSVLSIPLSNLALTHSTKKHMK